VQQLFDQRMRALFWLAGSEARKAWTLLSSHLSKELRTNAVALYYQHKDDFSQTYSDLFLQQCIDSNGEFVDLFKYRAWTQDALAKGRTIRSSRQKRREETHTIFSSLFQQQRLTEIIQIVTSYDLTDNMKWDTL